MKAPRIPPLLLAILLFVGMISMDLSICMAQSPWTQIADMPVAKNGHEASFLNGKLYVMGGIDHYSTERGDVALFDLDVYDPILDSWSEKADMLAPRFLFSSCAYNGKILAIGGSRDLYWTPVAAIDAYDPLSDTWTTITNIPKPGVWQAAVLLNDKIYVFGGAATEQEPPYAKVQIYDLLADTWSEGEEMLTPRIGHSAATLNGKIYVLGGQNTSAGYIGMNTLEVFDPETNTWAEKTGMIVPRKNPQSCELNGKIFVFGGMSGNGGFLEGGEIYDPLTDSWKELSDAPRVLGVCAGSVLNNKVYIGGGHNSDIRYKAWYIYDPFYDLFPLLEEVKVNKPFVNAGDDIAIISANMNEAVGITIQAILNTLEGSLIDSLMLFDDGNHQDGSSGDSLFANSWPVASAEELQYSLGIKVTRTDTVTVFNQFNNQAVITTKGLATVESFVQKDSNCTSFFGDCIWITLILRNNSSQYAAREIKVELESMDSLAWPSNFFRIIETIPASDLTSPLDFQLMISEDLPESRHIPIVVHISSFDQEFRSDTISIPILTSNNTIHNSHFHIYPNPASKWIKVDTDETIGGIIKIYSINGQLIHTAQNEGPSSRIDLSNFKKGVYIITIRSKDFVITRKIIKLF